MPNRPRLQWDVEALWQALDGVLPGISVEVLRSVDSTNTRLLERARIHSGRRNGPVTAPGQLDAATIDDLPTPHGRRHDDTRPCLLVAEEQSNGRGRQGRAWHADAGQSLMFSLSVPLNPPSWGGLSLAVGVALAEALDPLAVDAAPRIGLKWPNDLWVLDGPGRGRKMAGILIETVAVGERRMAVIGVGVNVLPQAQAQAQAQELSTGYGCLQELRPGIDPPGTLRRVALPLAQAVRRFEGEGLAPFVDAFRRRDLLRGRAITTTHPDVPQGLAEGIDDEGALRVRAAGSGTLYTLVSGEVSVRPSP